MNLLLLLTAIILFGVLFVLEDIVVTVSQVVISSIMCSFSKSDWTELAKMAEVRKTSQH